MIESVIRELKKIGYKPILEEYKNYVDVKFEMFGFDNFKESHMENIRKICGIKLMEFYYGSNTQHIYIRTNLRKEKLEKLNETFY
jgi:hypothetical protein